MRDERRFWYVPATIVAPGCNGATAEARFYACPLADLAVSGPVWNAVDTHRRISVDGVTLADVNSSPTPAALDAIATVSTTLAELRAHREAREYERAKAASGVRRG